MRILLLSDVKQLCIKRRENSKDVLNIRPERARLDHQSDGAYRQDYDSDL